MSTGTDISGYIVSSLRRGSLCQSRPPEGSLNGICDFPPWSHPNKCSTATHKSETRFAFHRPIPGRQVEFLLRRDRINLRPLRGST